MSAAYFYSIDFGKFLRHTCLFGVYPMQKIAKTERHKCNSGYIHQKVG